MNTTPEKPIEPTEDNVRPACHQDLLDGTVIFDRLDFDRFLQIVPGNGRHCSTIAGETYLMGWRWKDSFIGGGQGHLHKRFFKTASDYRRSTQSDPRLFVIATQEKQV